ncbi:MAG: ABC-type transport auxiliary lipoprotein family protein [Parvularculaceae bacterium]
MTPASAFSGRTSASARAAVAFFSALALPACVSVLPDAAPASARYVVSDVTVAAPAATPAAFTLGVEEPEATLAYNTAKIAIARAPGRIEYYAGGEWVDRAPRLFGVALVRSFENTGAIKGVGSRLTLPVSTYVLQTDIRRLGVAQAGADRRAEVAVFARLTNGRSRIHASKLFEASAPLGADTPAAAAAALDAALSAIQRDIVPWTLEEAAKAQASAGR